MHTCNFPALFHYLEWFAGLCFAEPFPPLHTDSVASTQRFICEHRWDTVLKGEAWTLAAFTITTHLSSQSSQPPFFSLLFQIKTHTLIPPRTDTVSPSTSPSMSPWKPALLAPPQLISVSTLACDLETGLGCDRRFYFPQQHVDPYNLYTRWNMSWWISAGPPLHRCSGWEEAPCMWWNVWSEEAVASGEDAGRVCKRRSVHAANAFCPFPRGCSANYCTVRHLPLYMNEHNGTSRQDDRCYEAGWVT